MPKTRYENNYINWYFEMHVILTVLLFSLSFSTVAEQNSSNENIFTQQLRIELKQKEQRELKKQRKDLEYAEQQRYLRQAEQDGKIRQLEDDKLEQEEKKRRWPERFDVKHGFY